MTSLLQRALAPFLVVLALHATAGAAQDGPGAPVRLRVDGRTAPLAVDDPRPRFSWEIVDPRRGAAQGAWQVLVSTSEVSLRSGRGELWDSGKVVSPATSGVEYAGKSLPHGRPIHWVVRTWDTAGRESPWSEVATFAAAARGASAWSASWIRAGRAPDAGSIGHKTAPATAEDAWPWIEFDFGGNVVCERVRLHPARPHGDPSKPGESFPLRVKVYTDATGKFADKAIRIGEYTWQDFPDAGSTPLEIEFGRFTLRWLRIVATKIPRAADGSYVMALGEVEVLDGGANIAPRGRVSVSSTAGEPGWAAEALVDGALVPRTDVVREPESLPRLRGSFTIDGQVSRAVLHASALGHYELSVNGKPIGSARLAPGWTDYSARVAYQTYDLAGLVQPGDNVIGVQLAPGWYAGRIGLARELGRPRDAAHYGSEPAFFAQGEVVLENGKVIPIGTDANWRWNRTGPVRSADLLDGEARDARREDPGWDAPLFAGTEWRPVDVASDVKTALVTQRSPAVRVLSARPAASVREVAPRTFLVDAGRNLSGVLHLRVAGAAGDEIVVRHGEALGPDGRVYTANLRGAAQTDRHILRGGAQVLEPRFTVHGFRYAEVEGLATLDADTAEVVEIGSALDDAGTFACSDPLLNRIWEAASNTVLANAVALPTNCPQRDERLGWLADAGLAAPFALHRFDAGVFLSSWLSEVRAAQLPDGRFPDFAPNPFGSEHGRFGAPGWADAAVAIGWELWLRDHDLRTLRSNAAAALRHVERVVAKNPDFVWRVDRGMDYGDWLHAGTIAGLDVKGAEVDKALFATAQLARSARLAARMTYAAGDAEANRKALLIADGAKRAFRAEFVRGDRLSGDAQGAYALAIEFGLSETEDEARAWCDRLAARVREQGFLTGGIHTAHRTLLALSRHGHHDLAVRVARRTELPSWGFMLEDGATTIWERWDGYVLGRGFADPGMNSLSHLAFGAIGEWLVRAVAGIEIEDAHPDVGSPVVLAAPGAAAQSSAEGPAAWSRIRLAPRVDGGLTSASADHRGATGTVKSAWTLDRTTLDYACTVPPGSIATLDLPAKDVASVLLGGKPLSEDALLKPQAAGVGVVRIELPSGTYAFRSTTR